MKNTLEKNTNESVKKADKQNSNYELFEKIEIEDTPFSIIIDNEKKRCFGVMGNYKITNDMGEPSEVRKELKKITWNRIIQVILILTGLNKEI